MKKSKRITASAKKAEQKEKREYFSAIDKEKNRLFQESLLNQISDDDYDEEYDDDSIKFYRTGNTIHDKSCKKILDYPDSELIPLERYDRTLCQCDACSLRSYIRIGTDNFYAIKFYEKIFKCNNIETDYLKELFLRGMTVNAGRNGLYVFFNEDNWKIMFQNEPNGIANLKKPVLWHNNYYIVDNKREIIEDEYHIQLTGKTLKECLRVIETYSFDIHQRKALEKESVELLNLERYMLDDIKYVDNPVSDSRISDNAISDNSISDTSVSFAECMGNLKDFMMSYQAEKIHTRFDMLDVVSELMLFLDNVLRASCISKADCETYYKLKQKYSVKL